MDCSWPSGRHLVLDGQEGFFINYSRPGVFNSHRGFTASDCLITRSPTQYQGATICFICEYLVNICLRPGRPGTRTKAVFVKSFSDFFCSPAFHRHGERRLDCQYRPGISRIRFQLVPGFVSIRYRYLVKAVWRQSPNKETSAGSFPQATFDILAEVSTVRFKSCPDLSWMTQVYAVSLGLWISSYMTPPGLPVSR